MPESEPPRVFLVVVDETPEHRIAVRYAARRAAHTGGRLALLYVIEPAELQHFLAIEELAREERRESAEPGDDRPRRPDHRAGRRAELRGAREQPEIEPPPHRLLHLQEISSKNARKSCRRQGRASDRLPRTAQPRPRALWYPLLSAGNL